MKCGAAALARGRDVFGEREHSSREAAPECSPGRKPGVQVGNEQAPKVRQKGHDTVSSTGR